MELWWVGRAPNSKINLKILGSDHCWGLTERSYICVLSAGDWMFRVVLLFSSKTLASTHRVKTSYLESSFYSVLLLSLWLCYWFWCIVCCAVFCERLQFCWCAGRFKWTPAEGFVCMHAHICVCVCVTGELTVPRYRTEKPSKSPPPPPPRRSFPSGHGLTTNSSGEVIIVNKSVKVSDTSYLFKYAEILSLVDVRFVYVQKCLFY